MPNYDTPPIDFSSHATPYESVLYNPGLVNGSPYSLTIVQQPQVARCSSVNDRAIDRRPIDPTPVVRLNFLDPNANGPSRAFNSHPSYFAFATLMDAEADTEIITIRGSSSRVFSGSIASSLYRLKDNHGVHGGFFVFPDVSVRIEGRFRIKFTLFEIVGNDMCKKAFIISDVFSVVSAKGFPGMSESSQLSRCFADQGLKIRVRKDIKTLRRKRGSKSDNEANESGEDTNNRASVQTTDPVRKYPKLTLRSPTQSNMVIKDGRAPAGNQMDPNYGSPRLSLSVDTKVSYGLPHIAPAPSGRSYSSSGYQMRPGYPRDEAYQGYAQGVQAPQFYPTNTLQSHQYQNSPIQGYHQQRPLPHPVRQFSYAADRYAYQHEAPSQYHQQNGHEGHIAHSSFNHALPPPAYPEAVAASSEEINHPATHSYRHIDPNNAPFYDNRLPRIAYDKVSDYQAQPPHYYRPGYSTRYAANHTPAPHYIQTVRNQPELEYSRQLNNPHYHPQQQLHHEPLHSRPDTFYQQQFDSNPSLNHRSSLGDKVYPIYDPVRGSVPSNSFQSSYPIKSRQEYDPISRYPPEIPRVYTERPIFPSGPPQQNNFSVPTTEFQPHAYTSQVAQAEILEVGEAEKALIEEPNPKAVPSPAKTGKILEADEALNVLNYVVNNQSMDSGNTQNNASKLTDETTTNETTVDAGVFVDSVSENVKSPSPLVDEPSKKTCTESATTSWWSYLKKQTDYVSEQYKKEIAEIVEGVKEDASMFKQLATSTLPALSTPLSSLTSSLTPQLTQLQSTLTTSLTNIQEDKHIKELKQMAMSADKYLESVENRLEKAEHWVGMVGKEFFEALVTRQPSEPDVENDPSGLTALRYDEETYTTDPIFVNNVKEKWAEFVEGFNEEKYALEIQKMLHLKKVREIYIKLVSEKVPSHFFWRRYFFKAEQLSFAAERRKRVLESVQNNNPVEEDISWGDEDEIVTDPVVSAKNVNTLVQNNVADNKEVKVKDPSVPLDDTDGVLIHKTKSMLDLPAANLDDEIKVIDTTKKSPDKGDDWDEWD